VLSTDSADRSQAAAHARRATAGGEEESQASNLIIIRNARFNV